MGLVLGQLNRLKLLARALDIQGVYEQGRLREGNREFWPIAFRKAIDLETCVEVQMPLGAGGQRYGETDEQGLECCLHVSHSSVPCCKCVPSQARSQTEWGPKLKEPPKALQLWVRILRSSPSFSLDFHECLRAYRCSSEVRILRDSNTHSKYCVGSLYLAPTDS